MKVFKLILTLIILCLIALFTYQNMETWKQLVPFKLNLYFLHAGPAIELYVVIVLAVLAGFIVGLAAMLKPYLKTRRLLRRERNEKKQAEEQLTMRQARAGSQGGTLDPANTAE